MKRIKIIFCKIMGHKFVFARLGYNAKDRHYKILKCKRCGKTIKQKAR